MEKGRVRKKARGRGGSKGETRRGGAGKKRRDMEGGRSIGEGMVRVGGKGRMS